MNPISQSEIPKDSNLDIYIKKVDYKDCYSFTIPNNNNTIQELYISIFSSSPKWVDNMMGLRNRIVRVFGLKTEMKRNEKSNFQVGEKVGIFNIFDIQENEIIAGEDDKHLNFRVSVYRKIESNTNVYIATAVHYNNRFGRFYMTIVKPFHRIVVKSLLKKAYKKLS